MPPAKAAVVRAPSVIDEAVNVPETVHGGGRGPVGHESRRPWRYGPVPSWDEVVW